MQKRSGMLCDASFESWAESIVNNISSTRPDMPPEITDRAADCWEPLFAVATGQILRVLRLFRLLRLPLAPQPRVAPIIYMTRDARPARYKPGGN
jgi:hypothetical protein